jgi:hypothetical protein
MRKRILPFTFGATVLFLAMMQLLTPGAFARDASAADAALPPMHRQELTLAYNHPMMPGNTTWVGAMVIIVLGKFLAAAVIGPYVRTEMPEEVPRAHAHEEPPGTSHHHGPGGTVQPGPEHDLPGGHGFDSHA